MNYGVSDHARTYCKRHDQFHPVAERCPWCEPVKTHHMPTVDLDWFHSQTWGTHNCLDDTYTTVDGTYTVTGEALRQALSAKFADKQDKDPDTDAYQYMVPYP